MFKSLYSKFSAVLLGLFLLVGISFVVVILFSTEMYQQEVNQRLNRKLAESIVAEKLLLQDNRINEVALKEIFHMLMVVNPTIEIYLLDPEGVILSFSAPPGKVKRKKIDPGPIKTWMDGNSTVPHLGDDPRNPDGKKIFTAARIPQQGRLEGYLYVILSSETYDSMVQKIKGSYILRLSAWAILASLLFALISGLVLFAFLTGRVKRLDAAMDAFKRSKVLQPIQLSSKKESHSGDEIDRLASTFKQMAGIIDTQMEALTKSDISRRELVANVSHDLRTPLATLQGYIETLLLKDPSLSNEERRTYLEIAIKHCERLNKLVADFFELSKLDSPEAAIQCEPFSLSELVQDVVQKFNLKAKHKEIMIMTNVEKERHFVYADIALVERVLENLLENALRYTPPGGFINIALTPEPEKIIVRVIDNGAGIPEEELPHIFDRFYQIDKSRRSGSRSSGLGLSITKRILALHDSKITVDSAVNSGTTFTFKLQASSPE